MRKQITEQGSNKVGLTLKPFLDTWTTAMAMCVKAGS